MWRSSHADKLFLLKEHSKMMIQKIIIVMIIFLGASCLIGRYAAYSKEKNNIEPPFWCAFVSASSLNIRNAPKLSAKTVITIPQGTVVKIIEETSSYDTIDGLHNRWFKVEYGKYSGYLFGGYIVRIDRTRDKVSIVTKALPLNRWNAIIGKSLVIDKQTKFIEKGKDIPVYKTTKDIVETKPFTVVNELLFFKRNETFHDDNQYETGSYSRFTHPSLGEVWILNNRISCTDMEKSIGGYRFILSTSEPVIEGDRSDYRLIVMSDNTVIDATLQFKSVGAYASAVILDARQAEGKIILTMKCVNSAGEEERAFDYTYAVFDEATKKIESIYENSYE